jgi:hypothetical protein
MLRPGYGGRSIGTLVSVLSCERFVLLQFAAMNGLRLWRIRVVSSSGDLAVGSRAGCRIVLTALDDLGRWSEAIGLVAHRLEPAGQSWPYVVHAFAASGEESAEEAVHDSILSRYAARRAGLRARIAASDQP